MPKQLIMPKTVQDFLTMTDIRNANVKTLHHKLYLRRGRRLIGEQRRSTFEIGRLDAIVNTRVKYISRGFFKNYLPELIELVVTSNQFDGIYIENVQQPRFQKFLMLRGFITVSVDDFGQRSMYYSFTEI